MKEQKKQKKQQKQQDDQSRAVSLMEELQGYEREGMHLYLDERPSRADEIVSACIFSEDSDYMRDFISDDKEHITEIHFIRITR